PIWQHGATILFLADRIKFCRPDGSEQPANSGAPPILAAFGDEAASRLYRCGIAGALVTRWHNQPSSPSLCNSRESPPFSRLQAAGSAATQLPAAPPLLTRSLKPVA